MALFFYFTQHVHEQEQASGFANALFCYVRKIPYELMTILPITTYTKCYRLLVVLKEILV